MIETLKEFLVPILKIDITAPHIPAGHESDAYLRAVRASPRFLSMRYTLLSLYGCTWLLLILIGTIITTFFPFSLWLLTPLIALIIGTKVLMMYITTRIDYDMRWYIITDTTLRVRYGVWSVQEITVSFTNVQNVRIVQGPVERLFDISTLIVDTAGGGNAGRDPYAKGHRAILRGIENPIEVRNMILTVLKMNREAGLGDPEEKRISGVFGSDIKRELKLIVNETGMLRQLFASSIA